MSIFRYLSQEKAAPEWSDLNQQLQSANLHHILAVMDLILTMAPSSAEAERGFSQLKLIKTDLRSTLGQDVLNQCLGIKMLSDDITTYDPLPAIDHWNGCGIRSRRPLFKTKKSRKTKTHTYEVVIDQDQVEQSEETPESSPEELEQLIASKGASDDDSDYGSEPDTDSDLDEDTVFSRLLDMERGN